MDDATCMVGSLGTISFTQSESCIKCVPCRLGRQMQMTGILGQRKRWRSGYPAADNKDGKGNITLRPGADLSQSGADTLNYFRDEYKAHIEERMSGSSL